MVPAPPPDSWYELVEGEALLQGDTLDKCPVLIPPAADALEGKPASVSAAIEEYDVVVVTHSCDLLHDHVNTVLVCPVFSLSEIEEQHADFKPAKMKDRLRRGWNPGYHMLAGSQLEGAKSDIRVADFRTVFSLPLDFAKKFAATKGPRLRLRSPYREDFSQAFARAFMRVALPAEIPEFK